MPSELPSADDPDPLGPRGGPRVQRTGAKAQANQGRGPRHGGVIAHSVPDPIAHEHSASGLGALKSSASRAATTAAGSSMPALLPFLLVVPSGLCNALSLVALPYFLAQRGVKMQEVGLSVAVSMLPHAWRFLLGPLADLWLRRRTWYLLAVTMAAVSAVGLYSLLDRPSPPLSLINLLLLSLSLGVAMADTAVASLAASSVASHDQTRAASAYTLGQLAWQGILGSLVLLLREPPTWLAARVGWLPLSHTGVGVVAGCGMLLAALTVLWVRESPQQVRRPRFGASRGSAAADDAQAVYQPLWRELVQFVRSRPGMLGLLACILPLGTSAIDCLEGALAGDYRATASHVAFVGGIGGTLAGVIGALAGSLAVTRLGRFSAYVAASASMGVTALALAILPASPSMYVVGMLFYGALASACAAAFNAYAFELIASCRAPSSVCGLLYGAVNIPLSYMLVFDGWAHTRAGRGGLFVADGLACLLAVAGLVAVSRARLRATEPVLSPATE